MKNEFKFEKHEKLGLPGGANEIDLHMQGMMSLLGYRDDSPFRNRPFIDIHTPNGTIDMSNTGIPLMANGKLLPAYSGIHQFDSNVVREIPLAQYGGEKDRWGRPKGSKWYGFNPQTKQYEYFNLPKEEKPIVSINSLPRTKDKSDNIQSLSKEIEQAGDSKQRYYNERTSLIPYIQQQYNVDKKRATEIAYDPNFDTKSFSRNIPQNSPDGIKQVEAQSAGSRAMDYITNPLDAFAYSVRTGDASNMPANYRQLKARGEGLQGNTVGDFLNSYNPIDAIDDTRTNVAEGDYLSALYNASRLTGMGYGAAGKKLFNQADDFLKSDKVYDFVTKHKIINNDPNLTQAGFNPFSNLFNKTKTDTSKNILSEYKNIEQLRLANKIKNYDNNHFSELFPDKQLFEQTKKEASELLNKYRSEFTQKFGKGTDEEVLLYGAHKDLENLPTTENFLTDDAFAHSTGLNTNLTNQQKFLGDAYQLEFSGYFNKNPQTGGNKSFADYLSNQFEPVITSNKINKPVQVKRTSNFNRPVKTIRDDQELMLNYDDLIEGDVIYPEHNWSTTSDLESAVWGSNNPSSKVARINLPQGQSTFRPNMYKGSQYANEEELVLPSKLGYKVSGINLQGYGDNNPRYIFDVVDSYKEGGEYEELELDDDAIKFYKNQGYTVEVLDNDSNKYQYAGETDVPQETPQEVIPEQIPPVEVTPQQVTPQQVPVQNNTNVVSQQGWDYKKEGDQYLAKRSGTNNWIVAKGKALDAIKNQVYNEPTSVTEQTGQPITPTLEENTPGAPGRVVGKTEPGYQVNKNLGEGYLPVMTQVPTEEMCSTEGKCSYNVSKKMGNLLGGIAKGGSGALWAEDAWFNKRDILDKKGDLVYETKQRNPNQMPQVPKDVWSKLQVGDYVQLDRVDTPSSKKYAADNRRPGNEGIEHLGFIVGKDADGVPLIWHGSEKGKAYIKRINEPITLDDHKGLSAYQVSSIVRSPALKDIPKEELEKIQELDYYKPFDKNKKLVLKNNATPSQKEAALSYNKEQHKLKDLGYAQDDILKVGQLLVGGIMGMESEGDTSSGRYVKQAAAYTAKDILGVKKAFDRDEASWGVYQMKANYNFKNEDGSLSKVGEKLKSLGIDPDDIFDNLKNQTIAGSVILLDNYDKLKKDKNYNPETDTYRYKGKDIPASYILAKSWSSGADWQTREKYEEFLKNLDIDYSKGALQKASESVGIQGALGVEKDLSIVNQNIDQINRQRIEQADYYKKQKLKQEQKNQQKLNKIEQQLPGTMYDLNFTNVSETTKQQPILPYDFTKPDLIKKAKASASTLKNYKEVRRADGLHQFYTDSSGRKIEKTFDDNGNLKWTKIDGIVKRQTGGESNFVETMMDDDAIRYYKKLGYNIEIIE